MTTGRPANFLRLAKCNLMCGGAGTEQDGKLHHGATWRCDTIEVWSVGLQKSFDAIIADMRPCDRLIITGGEPLMHQPKLAEFLRYLQKHFCDDGKPWLAPAFNIEVETNGTIAPSEELIGVVDQWNVSPKLANSGVKERIRKLHDDFVSNFNSYPGIQFKFVVTNVRDLVEIAAFGLPKHLVWLMPGADAADPLKDLAPQVAEWAKSMQYNFSNRLHIALWNQKTGV